MVSTRSRSTVKPPQNPLVSTHRRSHTTVSTRGSATCGQGRGQSRRGGGATNRAAYTSQHNPSTTPTDDAAQENHNNSPTQNDERDKLAHNQSNGNGDTEEFVDNGENDKKNHTTNINGNSHCDDDDDEPLTTEEKELYKPLYEDLVNHKKVELVLAQGPTQDSVIPPQALRQVTRLNEEQIVTI
ncbi:hypothetical protein PCANC_24931 [Puccinia coronata f. sp. avenae]|uniref:Uncharacterized protein n=1 Tax=Puccinia coronata f. sp. avenae TaxID=200324 RepID=A0A2N5S7S8_9BASI|nr:hypothetical protein PCANC_24931 [Puccinia coronata f. sp. avenae]